MPRIAIRPPEYFPRPEYFALMMAVDTFVVADTFQYSRQSYHNRARIRTPDGWSWISIPLAGGQHGHAIRDVRIDGRDTRWPRRHWRTLEYNYRSSPFFEFYEDTVASVLRMEELSLAAYTIGSLREIGRMLQIDTSVVLTSELEARPANVEDVLSLYPEAELWTLPDSEIADEAAERVLEWVAEPYPQNFPGFQPHMSSLDLIFNLGAKSAPRLEKVETRKRSGPVLRPGKK